MIRSREIIRQADRKWFKTQDWSAFNNHWGKDITGRGWGTGAGDTPTGYGVEKIGNDGGSKGKHKILEFLMIFEIRDLLLQNYYRAKTFKIFIFFIEPP